MPDAASWKPQASLQLLRARAELLAALREFFQSRSVLEVETPLLCRHPVTDPNLEPIACADRWLQTSPEYAMKRLLAADSGPIYQLCKAFRAGEAGSAHNPEFTLLEWYRPGFELEQLIVEVAELVALALGRRDYQVLTYRELFIRELQLDPFTASERALEDCVRAQLDYQSGSESRELWLDLLMSHVLEPRLAEAGLVFVRDYPASQAALARLHGEGDELVAERFELYVDGIELANGYCELTDPVEQQARFEQDNRILAQRGQLPRPLDEWLLQAMASGLPMCSGVALGIDRLLLLQQGLGRLEDGLSFGWSRC